MAIVLVRGDKAEAPIDLSVNGHSVRIERNVETPIPDIYLPALLDSDFPIEVIDDPETDDQPSAPDGEDGGGAGLQGADATTNEPDGFEIDPTFLDRSVAQIIPDLADIPATHLEMILAAEERGKTRKSLVAEITALIAAKREGDAPPSPEHKEP